MTEDQLYLVDNFEESIRAEADQDYVELYAEYSELQEQHTNLQQDFLKHMLEHTEYLVKIHVEQAELHKLLKNATVASNFYIMLSLVCIGYIIFTSGG